MKKLITAILFLLFIGIHGSFAQTLNDFFSDSEIPTIYLGVDFSKAKLINDPTANPIDIRDRLYNSINDLTVNESKKYDIGKAFHKSNVSSDLAPVKAVISKINAEDILSTNSADFNRFTEADIHSMVKKLDLSKHHEGVGVLFVVEAMRKEEKNSGAAVWMVLINMKEKKVLLAQRYEEKARGFGFRNFWASPIKAALDEIQKDYSKLKKQYPKD